MTESGCPEVAVCDAGDVNIQVQLTVEEHSGVMESVRGSTHIQKSVVPSTSHCQQIVKYATEGRLGAVTTSMGPL